VPGTSDRFPAQAARTAVEADTVVLPTPALPVNSRVRIRSKPTAGRSGTPRGEIAGNRVMLTTRRPSMRLGLQIPDFTMPGGPPELGSALARIGRDADQAGYDSLWVMDHFFQIGVIGPPEREMLEGYTTLAYLAAGTSRVRLGTLVTGVQYRYPGILVKEVTTLDVLSGGRAVLGIGAGWNEQESRGLGTPFPSVAERFERLEETLRIALQMWAGDETPFRGTHYTLERPLNSPQALTKPHPPILIGGGGERKTLRLAARYADACNFFGDTGAAKHKLEVLREH